MGLTAQAQHAVDPRVNGFWVGLAKGGLSLCMSVVYPDGSEHEFHQGTTRRRQAVAFLGELRLLWLLKRHEDHLPHQKTSLAHVRPSKMIYPPSRTCVGIYSTCASIFLVSDTKKE